MMLVQPKSRLAPFVANTARDCPSSPRPFHSFRTSPARPRAGLLHPVLAYALIAVLAVTGALLLGERGIARPLPCGENLAAACAAP